jgi:asparagine synthase (glutamine-hydrolysing)
MRSDVPHFADMPDRIFANAYEATADPIAEQARLFEWFDFGNRRHAIQSMFGIDLRDPTADKRLYEFCFSIPPEQYIADGHSRSLARRALKERIPESTRLSYKRGLQGADWYITVAEALPAIRAEVREIEASPAAREWIDMPRLHALLENWPTSGYEKAAISNTWHNALLRAVSLGYFLRTHDPNLQSRPADAAVQSA